MSGRVVYEPRARRGSSLRSRCRVRLRRLRPNTSAGHAFLDDSERVVDRGDAFAGEFLREELRLLVIDRGGRERDVECTVGKLREFDGEELPACEAISRLRSAESFRARALPPKRANSITVSFFFMRTIYHARGMQAADPTLPPALFLTGRIPRFHKREVGRQCRQGSGSTTNPTPRKGGVGSERTQYSSASMTVRTRVVIFGSAGSGDPKLRSRS